MSPRTRGIVPTRNPDTGKWIRVGEQVIVPGCKEGVRGMSGLLDIRL